MLRRAALTVFGIAAIFVATPTMRDHRGLTPGERSLAGLFGHSEAIALGLQYLAKHPGEADRTYLRQAVFGNDDPGTRARALRQMVERRERDFATGDVVELNGWLMGRTELRACALLALSMA